jgi:hypothetical protein
MATQSTGRGNTPPYVPYPSFKTLVGELREHGVPSRIDRSVLRRFSGIIGSQLLTALRFLGMIDDQNHPTQRLAELVAASNTPEWGAKIIAVLRSEYEPLFGLDLGNATASHFDETFRKAFPGSADSVTQKSIAFFLGAAKDSGIVISDRVMHGRKLRSASLGTARQPRKAKTETAVNREKPAGNDDSTINDPPETWEDRLIAKFPQFNPEWEASVQAKWFESFEKLMALRK